MARQHWLWQQTLRFNGAQKMVDEAYVRENMIYWTHDIDRAIELGYQGENLANPRSFYKYTGLKKED